MRGGRRPGAGAPKNNLNGLRDDNRDDNREARMGMVVPILQAAVGTEAAFPIGYVLIGAGLLSPKGFDRKDIPATGDLLFRFIFKMTPEEKAACIAHGKAVYEAIKKQSKVNQTQSIAIKHPATEPPASASPTGD